MRRLLLAIVVLAVVAVGWYVQRSLRAPAAEPPVTARVSAVSPALAAPASASAPAPAPLRPPAHATRISPELRRQIADRIAAAHAAREAASSGSAAPAPRPALDNPPLSGEQLEALKTPILGALRETVPFLKACFEQAKRAGQAPGFQIQGKLVLTGDPDVGTLVDADKLTDDHDRPLPPALDDCLRGELQAIELPPLREGDKVSVTYVFSDDEEDGK